VIAEEPIKGGRIGQPLPGSLLSSIAVKKPLKAPV